MLPRTVRSPTRRRGSPSTGAVNDTLISIRLSLTVGSRCRTEPESQFAPGEDWAVCDCAKRSAGTAAESAAAVEARRKSRRLVELIFPSFLLRATRLYNLRLPQLLDLAFAVAQLGEHLGGVLAQLRRRSRDSRRRAREPDRLVDDADLAELRALRAHRGAEMPHLRVGEHLVDRVDRAARHFGRDHHLDPLGGGARGERLLDLRIQRDAVLRAVLLALEVLALEQVLAPEAFADPAPHRFAGRGDVHVAVL